MTAQAPRIPPAKVRRASHRLAIGVIVLALVALAIALPIVVRSLASVADESRDNRSFSALDGAPATAPVTMDEANRTTFINLVLSEVDLKTLDAKIVVSGRRACEAPCPPRAITLYSIADADQIEQGISASGTVDLPEDTRPFSEEVLLPLRGVPERYPFDHYRLELGVAELPLDTDGMMAPSNGNARRDAAEPTRITFQETLADYVMAPPTPVEVGSMMQTRTVSLLSGGVVVELSRPTYLHVIAVVLVLVAAVSGLLAVFTRTLRETIVGIGGVLLGVWAIRSIVVPYRYSQTTAIDLMLSVVIVMMVIVALARAIVHLWRGEEHPPAADHREETELGELVGGEGGEG